MPTKVDVKNQLNLLKNKMGLVDRLMGYIKNNQLNQTEIQSIYEAISVIIEHEKLKKERSFTRCWRTCNIYVYGDYTGTGKTYLGDTLFRNTKVYRQSLSNELFDTYNGTCFYLKV